jgi:soluble lytic murein transglycosylase
MKEVVQAILRMTAEPEKRRPLLDELANIYQTLGSYTLKNSYNLLPVGRKELTEKTAIDRSADIHKVIADELVFLGLYDEAAPEFEAVRLDRSVDADDRAYTIAELYHRGGKADRGVQFMESRWKPPADFQVELIPKNIANLLYPAPYQNELIQNTSSKDIDPRFVLSIMRQESRFRPNATSSAAARGLMQFVSDTSNRIAGELGRDEFSQQDLYDPKIAILFGSQYLFDLYRIFPNQTEAVAASYNGGEENVKRWLARSHSNNADIYVSEIAYAQTKDYVFHVMTNYRVYRELYNADLSTRP